MCSHEVDVNKRRALIGLTVFLLCVATAMAVEPAFGGSAVFSITVSTDTVVGSFEKAPVQVDISFPEILSTLGVDGAVDPRSIRVKQGDQEVPFRLSDMLKLTGDGSISWRKRESGPEQFTIEFGLMGDGREYAYPAQIPLIGNGDYIPYGRTGTVAPFVGWMTHRIDLVNWFDADETLILISGHQGSHEARAGLFRIDGFVEGVPVLREVMPIDIQGSLVVGDFYGNGLFDLLAFSTYTTNITWYKNVGEPGAPRFDGQELLRAGGQVYDVGRGNAVRGIEVVDWDGDGLRDLLIGTSEGSGSYGSIYLVRNIGTIDQPEFAAPKQLEVEGKPIRIPYGYVRPAAYDPDCDGVADLITGNRLGDLLFIRNVGTKGNPVLLQPTPVLLPDGEPMQLPYQMHYVDVQDVDGDGILDLWIAPDEPFLLFARGTGSTQDGVPMFEAPIHVQQVDPVMTPGTLAVPSFVTLDEGAGPSIVAGTGSGFVYLFRNTGSGLEPAFEPAVALTVGGTVERIQAGPSGSLLGSSEANWGYTAPLITDWTGDGNIDIVLGSIFTNYRLYTDIDFAGKFDAAERKFLLNQHGGPFATVHRVRPEALDLQGSGQVGFLGLDAAGYLTYWDRTDHVNRVGSPRRLLYETGEEIVLSPPLASGGSSGRIKFAVGDWTGDGVWDVVLGTPMTHLNEFSPFRHATIFLLENVGSATEPVFRKPKLIQAGDGSYLQFGIHSAAPALVDLDGDGLLDIVVGAENGRMYFYARSYLEGQTAAEITQAMRPDGTVFDFRSGESEQVALPIPRDGLHLWLRADTGVEMDRRFVTRWQDQSGKDNHAVAPIGFEPHWTPSGIGGQPALVFDGSTSYLRIPHDDGLNASQGMTAFAVYRYYLGFRLAQKLDNSTGIARNGWFLMPQNGLAIAGAYRNQPEAAFPGASAHMQSNVYDSQSGEIRIYRNGALFDTVKNVPVPVDNEDDIYIARRHYPSGNEGWLQGEIAEIIIYNRAMSDIERALVEDYLRAKYAL